MVLLRYSAMQHKLLKHDSNKVLLVHPGIMRSFLFMEFDCGALVYPRLLRDCRRQTSEPKPKDTVVFELRISG